MKLCACLNREGGPRSGSGESALSSLLAFADRHIPVKGGGRWLPESSAWYLQLGSGWHPPLRPHPTLHPRPLHPTPPPSPTAGGAKGTGYMLMLELSLSGSGECKESCANAVNSCLFWPWKMSVSVISITILISASQIPPFRFRIRTKHLDTKQCSDKPPFPYS